METIQAHWLQENNHLQITGSGLINLISYLLGTSVPRPYTTNQTFQRKKSTPAGRQLLGAGAVWPCVQRAGDDLHFGCTLSQGLEAFGTRDHIDEEDVLLNSITRRCACVCLTDGLV